MGQSWHTAGGRESLQASTEGTWWWGWRRGAGAGARPSNAAASKVLRAALCPSRPWFQKGVAEMVFCAFVHLGLPYSLRMGDPE